MSVGHGVHADVMRATFGDPVLLDRVITMGGISRPLRHPVRVPAGTWVFAFELFDDGTAELTVTSDPKGKVLPMSESLNAYHLANIVAGYLDDRDDIASALVNPSEDIDQAVIEVTGQGGRRFVVPVVALREGEAMP